MSPFSRIKMADYRALVSMGTLYSYLRNEAIICIYEFWSHHDTKSVSMSSLSLSCVSHR